MGRLVTISYEDQVRAHNYALAVVKEKRKYFNCSYENYFIGALGELAYGELTNQQVNFDVYTGVKGDGGIDFPDGTDVKTSTWQGDGVQLKVSRQSEKCKQYALCRVVDEARAYGGPTKFELTKQIPVQVFGTISRKDFNKYKLRSHYDYDYVYADKLTGFDGTFDANYPVVTKEKTTH